MIFLKEKLQYRRYAEEHLGEIRKILIVKRTRFELGTRYTPTRLSVKCSWATTGFQGRIWHELTAFKGY